MDRSRPSRAVEAYPRLRIERQPGELEAGKVGYFFNERGSQIGEVFLIDRIGAGLKIGYTFSNPRLARGSGVDLLRIQQLPSNIGEYRRYFRCGGCKRPVAGLVFMHFWACRTCQGLIHRRQLVSKEVARFEQLIALQEQIGRGRPKGMWQSTYDRLAARRDELAQLYSPTAKLACVEHRQSITVSWLPPWQAKLAHEDFQIVGDAIIRRDRFKVETSAAQPAPAPAARADAKRTRMDPGAIVGPVGASHFFDD